MSGNIYILRDPSLVFLVYILQEMQVAILWYQMIDQKRAFILDVYGSDDDGSSLLTFPHSLSLSLTSNGKVGVWYYKAKPIMILI